MSTNYYWEKGIINYQAELYEGFDLDDDLDPIYHIGKAYSLGGGKIGFLWAQPPFLVENLLLTRPSDPIVHDEYGNVYSGRQFFRKLVSMKYENKVGQWFC